MNIIKNDTVIVLSGRDKGTKGKVLSADPRNGKLIVEGVSVASVHQKARRQEEQSAIIKKETPIYACKVMVVCPKCGKPTRVGHKITDGKKARVCKKCGAEL
ncbi:MAG: 50S ribosomal protein L24 [Oscillospiraceae bacterium]|nr:50S ribosomal protein L24 [Oscillospiraceae bacterium]